MTWVFIRSVVTGLFFVIPLAQSPSKPTINADWYDVLLAFVASFFGLIFVVGIQRMNSRSASVWRYPAWSINPFTVKEPLQLFHFVGYVLVAQGSASTLRLVVASVSPFPEAVLELGMGIGLIAGVWFCTVLFRGKMEHK